MIKFALGAFLGVNAGVILGYAHPHIVDEILIKTYGIPHDKVKAFREEQAFGKQWEQKAAST